MDAVSHIDELDPAALCAAFAAGRLPKHRWTHEAHLVVCRDILSRLDPAAALVHLRRAIRAYNEATGTANTDDGGYHETLTGYYVGAVHAVVTLPIHELVAHPSCSRRAPLAHWTPGRLFSTEARRTWVAPDLAPITRWQPRSDTSLDRG